MPRSALADFLVLFGLALLLWCLVPVSPPGWSGIVCEAEEHCLPAAEVFNQHTVNFPFLLLWPRSQNYSEEWFSACLPAGKGRSQLIEASLRRFRARAAMGMEPVIVHIGPSTLEREVGLYRKLCGAVRGLCRIFLVEPVMSVHSELQANTRSIGARNGSITVVHAAVCLESASNYSIYTVSDDLVRRIPGARRAYEWSSADQASLVYWATTSAPFLQEVPSLSAEEWSAHTQRVAVRCVSLPELLGELRLSPADVDYLVVDAEGHDLGIVEAALAIDALVPVVIQFEFESSSADGVASVVRALAAQAYDVHKNVRDVFAVYHKVAHPDW
mmetsp:Transcript_4308/g.13451  ORF Transcript_4308/g.13451 Transcript_4308/m.13451 type:complete len:330 (-) Transcript_4308:56-1045(-)